jgi:hypothetical protein
MEWRTTSSSGDVDGLADVLNGGLPSSFYSLDRAVPNVSWYGNIGHRIWESMGRIPDKAGRAEGPSRFGRT